MRIPETKPMPDWNGRFTSDYLVCRLELLQFFVFFLNSAKYSEEESQNPKTPRHSSIPICMSLAILDDTPTPYCALFVRQ